VFHATAPDPPNLSCGADVGDGIAVDQHGVGPSAGIDRAPVVYALCWAGSTVAPRSASTIDKPAPMSN
jgi:hypothetical protein